MLWNYFIYKWNPIQENWRKLRNDNKCRSIYKNVTSSSSLGFPASIRQDCISALNSISFLNLSIFSFLETAYHCFSSSLAVEGAASLPAHLNEISMMIQKSLRTLVIDVIGSHTCWGGDHGAKGYFQTLDVYIIYPIFCINTAVFPEPITCSIIST